jgi:hypothetical protein
MRAGISQARTGNSYTLGYGFGSVRSSAWYRGPCSGQDAGDRGRRGDGAKSLCFCGNDGGCWRCLDRCPPSYSDRYEGGELSRSTATAGRANHLAGAADRAGLEARKQTLWRGRVGAIRQAVGRALAGVDRSLLRDLCRFRQRRGVEDARGMAADGGKSRCAHAPDRGGGDGGALWILLREQLYEGESQGTRALAGWSSRQIVRAGGYT